MWPPQLALVTALAGTASAILVAPNSPCSQYCGNVLSATTPADMTCGSDSAYAGSAAGTVFESCINCELTSGYSYGNQTDLDAMIYNIRYALSYCFYGQLNNTSFQDNPCITTTACAPLEPAVDWQNMSLQVGGYDFCNDWIEVQVPKCGACLSAGSMYFEYNYIQILDAACQQRPAAGTTLSIQGTTPFSTTPMNVTTPTPKPLYTYTPPTSAISLGAKVGITIGGLVLLLSAAGFLIVCLGRRRRRAYLKSLEARYGGGGGAGIAARSGWPSPPSHDMFETPVSQKPLRGWDDNSPVSATTDRTENNASFPRYFSPYSSQFNSPVSALEDGHNPNWPTLAAMSNQLAAGNSSPASGPDSSSGSAANPGVGSSNSANGASSGLSLEEIERRAHERELAQIGIALGGSDPSLRSKNSNVSLESSAADLSAFPQPQSAFQQTTVYGQSEPAKGKGRQGSNESYELHQIDSNGTPTQRSLVQAPVLQHPGYGRGNQYYPPPPPPKTMSPYGGLTEDDAIRGNAM